MRQIEESVSRSLDAPTRKDETLMRPSASQAFPMFFLVWTLGTSIGSALGGFLSHPVEQMPGLFGSSDFFRKYPFSLPCLTSGCITALGVSQLLSSLPRVADFVVFLLAQLCFAFFLLEETLDRPVPDSALFQAVDNDSHESIELLPTSQIEGEPLQKSSRGHKRGASSSIVLSDGRIKESEEEWSLLELVKVPKVRSVVVSGLLSQLVAASWWAVFLLGQLDPLLRSLLLPSDALRLPLSLLRTRHWRGHRLEGESCARKVVASSHFR